MPEEIICRILRLDGYEVFETEFDEREMRVTLRIRQNPKDPFHTCGVCGIGVRDIHSVRERPVRDLPWGEWKLWLIVEMHRVICPRCGVKTERVDFLEGKQRYTKRFAAAVARECEDSPVKRGGRPMGTVGTDRSTDRQTKPRAMEPGKAAQTTSMDGGR